ncbi:MAG TPA: hypothetical protein DIT18_18110 [Pseudomonas sp.]|nr:hypothetical protein [Pseudomonas sp.]
MNLAWIDDLVDWRVLLRWSWMARGALLVLCLLLVPMLFYSFHVGGLLEAIERADGRHDELQHQWQVRSAEVDSRPAHEAQAALLEADLQRVRRALFDDDGLASLLQSLARLGVGLSFEQVTVLEPEPRTNHVELPLHLQVSGEYRALKRFLAGLGGLDQLVTLHELQLAAAEDGLSDVLRLSLRLQAYRAIQSTVVLASSTPSSVQPHNPFEALAATAVDLSLDQARMVGYLRDRQGRAALVRLGATVHLLREGDRFGDGQVVAIEEGRVELQGVSAVIPRVLTLFKG